MDENQNVRDDYKDKNEELSDPGRRWRRGPEEPWLEESKTRLELSWRFTDIRDELEFS